jgi:hypothetical protein
MLSLLNLITSAPTASVIFVMGIVLFLLGAIGKVPGKVYNGKIVELGRMVRVIIALFGVILCLIGSAVGLAQAVSPSPEPTPTPTPTATVPAPAIPVPTDTPTPAPTWKVIINNSSYSSTCGGITAPDGEQYLIIDASFENDAAENQVLSGQLFDLKDSASQDYTEDTCSNPGQSFAVESGKSIQTYTAFLVPSSQSCFTLYFIAANSINSEWNIGTCS